MLTYDEGGLGATVANSIATAPADATPEAKWKDGRIAPSQCDRVLLADATCKPSFKSSNVTKSKQGLDKNAPPLHC